MSTRLAGLRRRWSGNPLLVDALVAAALGMAAGWDWAYSHDPLWRLPLQLLISATVLGRRRYPMVAFALAVAAAVALRVSPGGEGNLAIALDAYAVGRFNVSRWWALAVAVAAALALQTTRSAVDAGYLLFFAVAWLIGDAVRQRAERLAAAERERVAAERTAAEERARIARELHDVIAHAVSVMVVQAEGAGSVLGRDPALAATAISSVAVTGREALEELRQLLEVLGDGGGASLAPAPGTADIATLAERMSKAGQPVKVRVEGEPREVPAALGLTAFRVVQEALTNAVKHARGAPTEVLVRYGPVLHLEVRNAAAQGHPRLTASAGGGRGLDGLRQRVELHRGRIDTGPTESGGFQVVVDLPIAAGWQ